MTITDAIANWIVAEAYTPAGALIIIALSIWVIFYDIGKWLSKW